MYKILICQIKQPPILKPSFTASSSRFFIVSVVRSSCPLVLLPSPDSPDGHGHVHPDAAPVVRVGDRSSALLIILVVRHGVGGATYSSERKRVCRFPQTVFEEVETHFLRDYQLQQPHFLQEQKLSCCCVA